ncbi:MAG: hypothetical protein J0L93_10595 [Deltaproteobacteria bacterium]|nr:hypothetical protein [Deltaproteobacteria bacterium]
MASSAFFIIFGYELLRSASTTLFNQAYGVQNLPIVMSFLPVALILFLFIYNKLLTRLGARQTLFATSLLCAIFVFISYYFILNGSRPWVALLYIFRECYVMLLIEQYWSFLNSRLKTEESKKLSGPVIGISSIGGILGGLTLAYFAQRLGTMTMLPLAAVLILPAILFSQWAYRVGGEPVEEKSNHDTSSEKNFGLRLFKQHRSLVFMFGIVVTSQILSNILMIEFQTSLQMAYPEPDLQTAVSGSYYAALNAASAALQFLLVPLILRFISYRIIHRAIPIVHLFSCAYMFLFPSLFSAGLSYFLFKALDYSIFKAAKELFYIPFSFDVRYRAKQIIDTFGYRFGKGGSSIAILFLQRGAVLSSSTYALFGFFASVVWLGFVLPRTLFEKTPSPSE